MQVSYAAVPRSFRMLQMCCSCSKDCIRAPVVMFMVTALSCAVMGEPLDLSLYAPQSAVRSPSPPASPPASPPPPNYQQQPQLQSPRGSQTLPPGSAEPLAFQWSSATAAPLQSGPADQHQPAAAATEPPQRVHGMEAPREGGAPITEITRSLEHLRSTVANMQESLRRVPEEGAIF